VDGGIALADDQLEAAEERRGDLALKSEGGAQRRTDPPPPAEVLVELLDVVCEGEVR
jgi:hypothetical protein